MEKEEIMCQGRGAPSGSVKKMAMAARTSKEAKAEHLKPPNMRFDDYK